MSFALDLSPTGVGKFWINGTLIATITGCSTTTGILGPIVYVVPTTTASRVWVADLVSCDQE
jgi:hypothetical protein